MAKKIVKSVGGALGFSKKKKDPAPADAASTNLPQPLISALSPEETRRRKLLRGKPPIGAGSTVLGGATNLSGTLGG